MQKIQIVFIAGTDYYFSSYIVSMRVVKERYTPYTFAVGKVTSLMDVDLTSEVKCFVDETCIHHGIIDRFDKKYKNGRWEITFESRGYSLLLAQNEPVPKMNYNVNLTTLAQLNEAIPNVLYQPDTENVNYVYVKERSTIWEAICAYSVKAYGTIPYIYDTNTVMVTAARAMLTDYSLEKIVEVGIASDRRNILSRVYMADVDGEYIYSKKNQNAVDNNIVRIKHYPLDKQWLSDPYIGLEARLNSSNKRCFQKYLTYIGFGNEQVFDQMYFKNSLMTIAQKNITRVEINVHDMEIFTTLHYYDDGNC